MSTYNVPCVIAITGTLPNGGGTIASGNYTITPDLSTLPTGFMTADTAGHFAARFNLLHGGTGPTTLSPLRQGDKVNFIFQGGTNSGITVTDVTRPPNYAFNWTKAQNGTNSFTLTGVVPGPGAVDKGGDNFEYSIALTINSTNYTIDPDFETDVSDNPNV